MALIAFIAFMPSPLKKVEANQQIKSSVKTTVLKPISGAEKVAKAVEPVASAETPAEPKPVPQPPAVPSDKQSIMAAAGIAPGDYGAVDYIITHESGWCHTKSEGEYGSCQPYHGHSDYNGYGLCQSTPPQKMATAGADWETNPVTQLKWCAAYAQARYGGWGTAYSHWLSSHNW